MKNFVAKALVLFLVLFVVKISYSRAQSRSKWSNRDAFEDIMFKVNKVNGNNCKVMHVDDLHLSKDSVSDIPVTKKLGTEPLFPNRTSLLQVHNTALSRGIFFSFILQKAYDDNEPGLLYHYMSVIADVAANRVINASATYFSPNMSFTPSYSQFFNKTMPLFAPRAYRSDDFNDPIRLQRISTLNTIVASDLGAVPNNSKSMNYSHEMYKINRWFKTWLPDSTKRQDSKITYSVDIAYGNGTNETFVFHGPPAVSDQRGPVEWFVPYFDCQRSNKWLTGGAVPITDRYARHTKFKHIEFPRYVAISVVETDYINIDINQCPREEKSRDLNAFAGTAICKNATTMCEPIHGFGLRRGGYQCRCKPGYKLPRVVRTPFLGEVIERASFEDYKRTFNCNPIGYKMVLIHNRANVSSNNARLVSIEQQKDGMGTKIWPLRGTIDPNIISDFIKKNVTVQNCHEIARTDPEKLKLPSDVAAGKEIQLENEARMALRLAHFISSFLQSRKPNAKYAEYRQPDKDLTEDQMIGEVLSTVMGNFRIQGAGIFFDVNKFPNKTTFAPYAYRTKRNTRNFNVIDWTRLISRKNYLLSDWFQMLKTRWATSTDDLEEYIAKINIRFNSSGEYSVKFDEYPVRYKAAELRHGHWTQPYFDCGGFHDQWVITYAAPFFGWDAIRHKLEFKGVVTTTMNLRELDINQCSGDAQSDNAFRHTNKCDKKSTWCVPIMGRGYNSGGYKCECNQGYEYPFTDQTTYFDGEILESEFIRLVTHQANKYDTLKCRIAGSSSMFPSVVLILGLFLLVFHYN